MDAARKKIDESESYIRIIDKSLRGEGPSPPPKLPVDELFARQENLAKRMFNHAV